MRDLAFHIRRMRGNGEMLLVSDLKMADAIHTDPQAHIDALVKSGVLSRYECFGATHYAVVHPPHTHTWQVSSRSSELLPEEVLLWCTDRACKETRRVPNKLPLEVPE